MCLVRIEKMPKLQTSCTIICTDGMVVTTQSEEIEKAQRSMLEFLLANHPLDCPVCDRGGECELQELTFDWGNLEERFIERKNVKAERYLSPMVANDPQRCILCKRCTRVCDEWMGEEANRSRQSRREHSDRHVWRLAELFAVRQLHRGLSHRDFARRNLPASGAALGTHADGFNLQLLFGWLPDESGFARR
jgi:NADH dehydrogenase/NADH:ubiquinone oxidoreductase subunit G